MATTHKALEKPIILTESDKIIHELKEELSALGSRVDQLEAGQEEQQDFINNLSGSTELYDNILTHNKENNEFQKEKYQALAHTMTHLKTPVRDVIDNLNGLVQEIPDPELQETLKDCMNTAASVLESFNMAEDFCHTQEERIQIKSEQIDIKDFMRHLLISLQKEKGKFRLKIDRTVPKSCFLDKKILTEALQGFIEVMVRSNQGESNILVHVFRQEEGQIYGKIVINLVFQIKGETLFEIPWKGSWFSVLKEIEKNSGIFPINLLQIRDNLRNLGGEICILEKNQKIASVEIKIPVPNQ